MGLAASQARLLSLTARLSDLELQAQMISNSKIRLAVKSEEVATNYTNALNNKKLMIQTGMNGANPVYSDVTANLLTSFQGVSQTEPQRMLKDNAGRVLTDLKTIENFKTNTGNLEGFLNSYGLTGVKAEPKDISALEKEAADAKTKAEEQQKAYDSALEASGIAAGSEAKAKEAFDNADAKLTPEVRQKYTSLLTDKDTYEKQLKTTPQFKDTPVAGLKGQALEDAIDNNPSVKWLEQYLEDIENSIRDYREIPGYPTEPGYPGDRERPYNRPIDIRTPGDRLVAGDLNELYKLKDETENNLRIARSEARTYYSNTHSESGINPDYKTISDKLNTTNEDIKILDALNGNYSSAFAAYKNASTLKEAANTKAGDELGKLGNAKSAYKNAQTALENARSGKTSEFKNDPAAVQHYTNLYNELSKGGYIEGKDNELSSADWLEGQLKNGNLHIEKYSQTAANGKPGFNSFDLGTDTGIKEVDDTSDDAKAEAEYQASMTKIQSQDKIFDLELKQIDTEHTAIQTEYESVKKVMDKNIDRSFKIFS